MADETQETITPEKTVESETPKTIDPAEFAKVQAALKEANKEAADRRKKLDAYEKADADRKAAEMTESEKAAAKIKAQDDELAQLKREKLIRKVADDAGLPADLAELLQGSTEDELKAHAEKLKKYAPATPEKPKLKIDPTNPGNAHLDETREQKKARLNPQQIDPFARGGGINWEPGFDNKG
jgi:hypothetical protein